MGSQYKYFIVINVAVLILITWMMKPTMKYKKAYSCNTEPTRVFSQILRLKIESDNSKRFGIIRNVFNSTELHQKDDLTVVIHMDISRMPNVVNMADNFLGPVQACIFISSEYLLYDTVKLLSRFRNTNANVKRYVDWHIMYPLKLVGPENEHFLEEKSFTGKSTQVIESNLENYSTTIKDELDKLVKLNFKMGLNGSTLERLSYYPHTIALNVALNATKSTYLLSMDGDLTPSKGMRNKFNSFAKKHNLFADSKPFPPISKILRKREETDGVCFDHSTGSLPPPDLYVVPAFMTKKSNEIPRTVKELRVSVQANTSKCFYCGMHDPAYGPTNHSEWLKKSDDAENAVSECLYEVPTTKGYEPFVIARKSIPKYDERFSGFFFVEEHHKKLLAHLQYNYKVLGNVFLVHDTWKTRTKNVHRKSELKFHKKNWSNFNQWLKRLSKQENFEISN